MCKTGGLFFIQRFHKLLFVNRLFEMKKSFNIIARWIVTVYDCTHKMPRVAVCSFAPSIQKLNYIL